MTFAIGKLISLQFSGFCLALFLLPECLPGQDSTKIGLKDYLEIDIAGGGFYQASTKNKAINLPDFIKTVRNPRGIYIATDNPLFHGAYYFDIYAKLQIIEGVSFQADFIGEHRGFSYGVYDTNNMIIFPRGAFIIDKTISLWNKPLNFFISVGNKPNATIYEGLTLANIDAQGWDIHVQWGHFRFTYYQLSDVQNWIGLNISDSYDSYISLEGIKIFKHWKSDIRLGIYNYETDFLIKHRTGIKFSSGFYSKDWRVYMELNNRFNENRDSSALKNIATMIGVNYTKTEKKWSLKSKLEFKYYGSFFNKGYRNRSVKYRDPAKGIYANTIGDNLYPLSLYNRPLNQWALFTEYQNKDVKGLIFQASGKYFIHKRFFIKATGDINYIFAEGEKPFAYPFYAFDIGWEPLEKNSFSVGITNKGMNLDVHYPTFYLYKYPFFNLSLKRDINDKK